MTIVRPIGAPVVRPSNTPERICTPIRLPALTGVPGLTGAAPVEVYLDVLLGQLDVRGHPVDNATNRRAVALTEGREAKQGTEGITGHALLLRLEALQHFSDIRSGVGRQHADHVETGVDVVDLAGHARRQFAQQIDPGATDVLEGNVPPETVNCTGSISGYSGYPRYPRPPASSSARRTWR